MNEGVMLQLFIRILHTAVWYSGDPSTLLPQLCEQCLNQSLYITELRVCLPQLMGLVRRGWGGGELRGDDKGQDARTRLEDDQTEQMLGSASARTERRGQDDHGPERRRASAAAAAATAAAAAASAHARLPTRPRGWRWCRAKRIWQISLTSCLSNNRWIAHGDYYSQSGADGATRRVKELEEMRQREMQR